MIGSMGSFANLLCGVWRLHLIHTWTLWSVASKFPCSMLVAMEINQQQDKNMAEATHIVF